MSAAEHAPLAASGGFELLLAAGASRDELESASDFAADALERAADGDLGALAAALRQRTLAGRFRRALVARDRDEARATLRARDPARLLEGEAPAEDRAVAFLLPGVGDQYPGMARELYQREPAFRRAFELCADGFRRHLGLDPAELLYGDAAAADRGGATPGIDLRALLRRAPSRDVDPRRRLAGIGPAQAVTFTVEYALARLWMAWGIRPRALLGYSLGEYVAAALAEILTVEDAVALVAKRALVLETLPEGAMLAVMLPEEALRAQLGPELFVAAVNGESQTVAAGPAAAVAALEERLTTAGVIHLRVATSRALHSPLMAGAAPALADLVHGFKLRPPAIPCLSNVTGGWLSAAEAIDPDYWARHLVSPVRFADALDVLLSEPVGALLEVGAGHSLASLALQHPRAADVAGRVVLPSLRHVFDRQDDKAFLLGTLGRLWLAGVAIDWDGFAAPRSRRER